MDAPAPPILAADRVDFSAMHPFRMERLHKAALRFAASGTPAQREDFARFQAEQASWLPDFALFMSLCEACGWKDWCEWELSLAKREAAGLSLRELAESLGEKVCDKKGFFSSLRKRKR